MKKSFIICILTTIMGLGAVSCSNKSDKIKEFAVGFAEKASKNQIDSLKLVYPGIENADSIALKYVAEGIVVKPSEEESQYEVILSPDVTIWVKPEEDGSFSVVESKGLFAFPQDKLEIVKKYGFPVSNISDTELSKNVKDAIQRKLEDDSKIMAAMPTVNMYLNNSNGYEELTEVSHLRKLLVEKGYDKINENKYVLNPGGDPSVTVTLDYESWYLPEDEVGGSSYEIRITFSAKKDADDFYQKCQKSIRDVMTSWVSIRKEGNTVILHSYSD